jgi:hypothetical protein
MKNARSQIDEGLENQRVCAHKNYHTLSFRLTVHGFHGRSPPTLPHSSNTTKPSCSLDPVCSFPSVRFLYFVSLVSNWTTWTQRQRHFLLAPDCTTNGPLRRVCVTAPYLYICVAYQFHLAAAYKCLRRVLHATRIRVASLIIRSRHAGLINISDDIIL